MIPNNPSQNSNNQQPRILCKTDKLTLSSKLSPDEEQVTLILQLPDETEDIINIYESNIDAKSQVGQVLDNLHDLMDYLEDSRNFKVNSVDGSIVVVSRTEVKGKQKEIQVCKIQMSLKKTIKLKDQTINNWTQNLQQIQKACQSLDLPNTQITKYIGTITRYLLQAQTRIFQQNQSQSPDSSIQPIINKIVQLGKQQQMIKDKIAYCNDQIKQVQAAIIHFNDQNKACQLGLLEMGEMIEEVKAISAKRCDLVESQHEDGMIEMKKFMNKIFEELSRQIQLLKKPREGKILELPSKIEYNFSSTLKHRSIKLLSPKSIQGIDNIRSKICLITPCLNPSQKKIGDQQQIYMKVVNEASDILLGVCDLDRIRNLNYGVQSWGTGNHGGYYINSGGYLYSCYRKEDNDILKSFTFRDGDVIKIVVNEAKRNITFENGSEMCRIDYDNKIRPDRLYFCVVLHKSSSIVEIFT